MKFAKFNKARVFDVDTSEFEYTNLEELYNENGEEELYTLRGVYIGTKSQFDPEVPIVAIDDKYVNIPVHQLEEVKAMLDDKSAIAAINNGEAGFRIVKYLQKRYKRDCFKAEWLDI